MSVCLQNKQDLATPYMNMGPSSYSEHVGCSSYYVGKVLLTTICGSGCFNFDCTLGTRLGDSNNKIHTCIG